MNASHYANKESRLALRRLLFPLLALLSSGLLAAPPEVSEGSQSRQVNTLTIVLSGRMLYNKGAQEGIMLSVPWSELVDQFFPRQSVPVAVEFWKSGPSDRVVVFDDARKRSFEPERAKALLARQFSYNQQGLVFRLFCDPDLCHVAHWVRPFLDRVGLEPSEPINHPPDMDKEAAAFWIHAD